MTRRTTTATEDASWLIQRGWARSHDRLCHCGCGRAFAQYAHLDLEWPWHFDDAVSIQGEADRAKISIQDACARHRLPKRTGCARSEAKGSG